MSYRTEEPGILAINDMFVWWCKQKIRNKRHMKIKYEKSHSHDTILVSNNKDEITWLNQHIEVLKEQIATIQKQESGKKYFTKNVELMYQKKAEVVESRKRIEDLSLLNPSTEQVIMNEKKFKSIIYEFNKRASTELVKGGVINMKQYLGFIYVHKIQRNHPAFVAKGMGTVNWVESYKYKQELTDEGIQIKDKQHPDGKNWLVYYTDDFFLKFTWTKKSGACRVKNHMFYGFYPAKGTKKKLSIANKGNVLLHKSYVNKKIYYPRLKKTA